MLATSPNFALQRSLGLTVDLLQHVNDRRILLAHDNLTVLTELFNAIEHAEAWPIGPATSVRELNTLLEDNSGADGAVLNVTLNGHATLVAAEQLVKRQVPIVFMTDRRNVLLPPTLQTTCIFSLAQPAMDILLALFSPRH